MDDLDPVSPDNGDKTERQPLYALVSEDEFAAVDLNNLTGGLRRVDRHVFVNIFSDKAKEAAARQDSVAERVYRLLSALTGLHLRVESEGDPFGPQWQDGERRTAVPHDFRGRQAEILANLASTIVHPALRARIADVAYEAGAHRAGRTAVGSGPIDVSGAI